MKVGIIGGSGLDDPKLLQNHTEKQVMTPYGAPSSALTCGTLAGVNVCILARHGKKHELPPTHVNYRANIHALKAEGCTHVLATTAVGSLREEIGRGDFVILDQFIDFTRHRSITFHDTFANGPVHASLADPFSAHLRGKLIDACKHLGIKHHPAGTVVTIEGPRFSTRAESRMFRAWGADVINMSIAPEATLAREAGLEYAAIAMSTDYDCWKTDEHPVSWDDILNIFHQNADKMKKLLLTTIETLR
jgi:5'-methylthioadenosine phosphorylase